MTAVSDRQVSSTDHRIAKPQSSSGDMLLTGYTQHICDTRISYAIYATHMNMDARYVQHTCSAHSMFMQHAHNVNGTIHIKYIAGYMRCTCIAHATHDRVHATCIQRACNILATHMQHACNVHVQDTCNIDPYAVHWANCICSGVALRWRGPQVADVWLRDTGSQRQS